MRKKHRCPVCGKGTRHSHKVDDTFDFFTSSGKITVNATAVPMEICDHCGERFLGPEAGLVRNRASAGALGLLLPEQIQHVRKRWGLSLQRFAKLTGIEAELLSDWEKGRRLPSRAFDNYLRLLDTPRAQFIFQRSRAG